MCYDKPMQRMLYDSFNAAGMRASLVSEDHPYGPTGLAGHLGVLT
jgi:hypothetical protein